MNHMPKRSLSSDEWAMPTNKVAHFVFEMEPFGVAAPDLLKDTGITYDEVSDPNSFISFSQSTDLIRNLLNLNKQPGIGLYLGHRENIGTCGLMGYAMSCAPNIERALELCVTYLKASPTLTDVTLDTDGDDLHFIVAPIAPAYDTLPFIIEEMLSATLRIFHLISGTDIVPSRVMLSYDDPGYADQYHSIFQSPIQFGAPVSAIVFKRSVLELPTLQGNPVAEATATTMCEQHLKMHGAKNDVAQKVRRELLMSPGNFPGEEIVANRLAVSSRSLRRQLRQHGTSFQKILDSVREQLAIEYLQHTQMPLESIAELVGFSDARNFRRAFKRWTNKKPSEMRSIN